MLDVDKTESNCEDLFSITGSSTVSVSSETSSVSVVVVVVVEEFTVVVGNLPVVFVLVDTVGLDETVVVLREATAATVSVEYDVSNIAHNVRYEILCK